jgi:hypothetical protein
MAADEEREAEAEEWCEALIGDSFGTVRFIGSPLIPPSVVRFRRPAQRSS